MAQKLSSLFFSTAKNLMRLQRNALKLTKALPIPRKKKVAAKTISKKVLVKQTLGMGAGNWCQYIYQRQPSSTELLGELSYFIYRPPTRPLAGIPLVVVLHGCQQVAPEIALGTGMNLLADQQGFMVLYPQQAKRVNDQHCWRWFEPDGEHGLAEADDIAGLIRATVARYKLDKARVYICGLSAGAAMAGMVAIRHPKLIAAVGMHSGPVLGDAHSGGSAMLTMRRGSTHDPTILVDGLLEGSSAFPGMPAIIVQGRKDHVVAMPNAQQLLQQFTYLNQLPLGLSSSSSLNHASAAVPVPKVDVLGKGTSREYHRTDVIVGGDTVVRLCTVDHLGHAWSGGNPVVKFHAARGPKASLLMWQFFSKQRRA
ncbi:MAG: PHB depolymerase family esterase [Burkholderiaceae bacterium]|nr:PHB depolymerase family esterase [Burkholderiaceae bacterium]